MAGADRSAPGRLTTKVVLTTALVLWMVGLGESSTLPAEPEIRPEPARDTERATYREATARFAIRVDDLDVPLRVLAIPVVPGQSVRIASPPGAPRDLEARSGGGTLRHAGDGAWTWTAPPRGFHAVHVFSPLAQDTIRLTFMVSRPANEIRNGHLDGYAIGEYRPRPRSMSAAYGPPEGFIEVSGERHDVLVSPNFRLGQFLCKQPGDPKFVLVSGALLVKLEALLAAVNDAGRETPTLTVMSGFRTPAYNRAIGNTTDFSRHLWGDAADVFVDNDGNGRMDDLNGDGRLDIGDARWLSNLMEQVMRQSELPLVPGGLAVYRPNDLHGGFVHVDARGARSRW